MDERPRDERQPTRRDALRWTAGAGASALLAACGRSAGPGRPSPSGSSTARPSATATPPPRTPPPSLATLSRQLSTPLLRPGSAGYATRAGLYDPRFDAVSRPAAIAACATTADVATCVRFAADGGAPLRLRAGGHSYGGWSTGSGLVADVRPMSGVAVDTAAGLARIGAGASLAAVYGALAARGVAVAAGSCPTVGLTGLLLGGGVGVLSRAFGLTCDALRSAEVVTTDGRVREVDARTDADLFWALRGGGGGSFGAVTALTLAVRSAPTVHTFYLAWPAEQAAAVLTAWQPWTAGADRRLWSTAKLLADPGSTGLRAVVAGTWIGPASDLQGRLAPLLAAVGAPPAARGMQSLDYGSAMLLEAGCSGATVQQCLSDALTPAHRQPFAATSAVLTEPLPSAGITAAVDAGHRGLTVPGVVEAGISFDALGGAVADLAPSATAFVHREALATVQYTATYTGGGTDPAPFDRHVRGVRAQLLPWTGGSAYVNYPDAAIADYPTAYWGANAARLREVKRAYDPHEVLTFPQAVRA